jgi:YXWGXW repeat-containing protein
MRAARSFVVLLWALGVCAIAPGACAQVTVGVSIAVAPPLLPVYVQPRIPAPGYLWTPGYWAWGPGGYFWVPGTWVVPPAVGVLWTPGYWGWRTGFYVWNGGYWGPHVGFYGGVNYGFGYVGVGYAGGYWANGAFSYNRSVNNISNTHITNVYNQTVVNNTTVNNVSYNGGAGGTTVQPTPQELAVAHEQHTPPTPLQAQHEHAAGGNHVLLASVNHGHPAIAATSTAGKFSGQGIVAARGSHAPTNQAVVKTATAKAPKPPKNPAGPPPGQHHEKEDHH